MVDECFTRRTKDVLYIVAVIMLCFTILFTITSLFYTSDVYRCSLLYCEFIKYGEPVICLEPLNKPVEYLTNISINDTFK